MPDNTEAKDQNAPSPLEANFLPPGVAGLDTSPAVSNEEQVIIDGRVRKATDPIYDLWDVVEDEPLSEPPEGQEIIVIDGRVYERVSSRRNAFGGLQDRKEPLAGPLLDNGLHEEIMKAVVKIAEGIVRETVPEIAERLIRQEIENLKSDTKLS